jgi:hypothetical protein
MEDGAKISVWWLFLGGSVLISAAWFMKPFPVFMFIGLAPFFAILDHTIESENFWENTELILLGMALYFFAAFQFDTSLIIKIVFLAILFTLPFLGFAFAHEYLGPRTGKFIIIIFWLALEYGLLALGWPKQTIYLADALEFSNQWSRWNIHTGYLGVSAWILITNWILYAGLLRGSINWYLVILGLGIFLGPLAYSLMQEGEPLIRKNMIELYTTDTVSNVAYRTKGELVARTCGWLSLLILLFTLVKSRISKQ